MNSIITLILILTSLNTIKLPDDILTNFSEKVYTTVEVENQYYAQVINSELEWLDQLLLKNGAISTRMESRGEVTVVPYFANLVAMTLVEENDSYQEEVRHYMDWYLKHLNGDGSIYDYKITLNNGVVERETSKGTYDSIDSYAATFLTLVNTYLSKTGDVDYINGNMNSILRVSDALLMTRYNGLTVNNFTDYNQYLMDNLEVYEACQAMVQLLSAQDIQLDDPYKQSLLKAYRELYKSIGERIENEMWDDEGYYHFVLFKDNKAPKSFDWKTFYPDAIAQIFPIMYDFIPSNGQRAKQLYDTFNRYYAWERLSYIKNKDDKFLWSQLAYVAVLMNDVQRFNQYIESYYDFLGDDRGYPYFSNNSVWLIKAARTRIDNNDRLVNLVRFIERLSRWGLTY